ncbi:uncharacterized protein LOC141912885 isoform X1 [Tubulanus polymorphus]|uniref:uncharacterized protein LOC141912885 isoform X1 n=1 Tax=Tubulanus polymorphus TaxID=672921 RepID=UPI003DA4DBD4
MDCENKIVEEVKITTDYDEVKIKVENDEFEQDENMQEVVNVGEKSRVEKKSSSNCEESAEEKPILQQSKNTDAGAPKTEKSVPVVDEKDKKSSDRGTTSGDSGATAPSAALSTSKTTQGEAAAAADEERNDDGQVAAAKSRKIKQEEERQKLQLLVSNFSESQLNRYEMFRRAAFPKAAVKRLMQSIAGTSISQNVVIAMSGIAKVYVGEIVEEALNMKEKLNEEGPLQPKHLREAVRVMRQHNAIPNTKYKKRARFS